MTGFVARQEHFAVVGSTNDVVREWLVAGTPEVCLAVADAQTAGRGREGRTWVAPPGAALLLSVGFRPTWLDSGRVWQLAATVSLAMASAAEAVAGLPAGAIHLKWPNDLVIERTDRVRKVAGVLGETDGLGGPDPRAVIGIGTNTNWQAADFPPELAGSMTSLLEASSGRAIDHRILLDAFVGRLEASVHDLRRNRFDAAGWIGRQLTTGRQVELVGPDGTMTTVRAVGVDAATGALVIEDHSVPGSVRQVVVGEIRHVRVPTPSVPAGTAPTGAGV